MGAVDFSIDTKLVACVQRALPISVFVETGTFEGEAIARVRGLFEEIHSIELSDHYYAQAADRFAGDEQVRLHHGDSRQVLASLRPTLGGKAVLYWLDAHWCVADETAGARSQCPLLDELAALGHLNTESVLIIDDARLFLATPPAPHESSDWPRFQQVLQKMLSISPSHETMVVNDVIVFFPETAREALTHYARSHGTDWLAELHRRDSFAHAAQERLDAIHQLTMALEECTERAKATKWRSSVGPLIKRIKKLTRVRGDTEPFSAAAPDAVLDAPLQSPGRQRRRPGGGAGAGGSTH